VLGPLENNTYLLADQATQVAAVIDPAFDSERVVAEAENRGWRLAQVWLTHAHFDPIAGVATVATAFDPPLPVGLHPDDLKLYRRGGNGNTFGFDVERGPEPSILFSAGQVLKLGKTEFQIRFAPGHTPGHVVLYSPEASALFCGDVIFQGSIGRTDIPGGDYPTLMESIRTQVLTLPGNTRLYPGHGPSTTVAVEKITNPFLQGFG
jgi:hydroxyacylglutathione hydrolase